MIEAAIQYSGTAVMLAGAALLASLIVALAGWLVMRASTFLFRQGLMFIRLGNWFYWNVRMQKEGLIAMNNFYKEQVAIHKPKTLKQFKDLDRAASVKERDEAVASDTEVAP